MPLVYGLCTLRFKHFVRGKKVDALQNVCIPADCQSWRQLTRVNKVPWLVKIHRMMIQEPISRRADNALTTRCESLAALRAPVLKRPVFNLAAYVDNNDYLTFTSTLSHDARQADITVTVFHWIYLLICIDTLTPACDHSNFVTVGSPRLSKGHVTSFVLEIRIKIKLA